MTPITADPAAAPEPRPGPGAADYAAQALKALSSLRLTVGLLAASVGLVFLGTVAQMESGLWTVVYDYFWSLVVWVPFDLFRQFASVFLSEWFPKDGSRWGGTFPFPAGQLLGGAMLLNLLAAHATRFRLSWKRSGVILLHSGLILLFVGEFVTREFAVEQRMRIREGASANYTEDYRHMELAFVTPDGDQDKVIVVPERLLRAGGRVSAPDLPVDVQGVDYFSNARMEKVTAAAKSNPATTGVGRGLVASRIAEVSGADAGNRSDLPAAYVRLFDKESGKEIGTHLVGAQITMLGGHDEVTAGGKTYQLTLRNIRYYKPYSIQLHKFTFERYPGTQKPKNFSSDVTLSDPAAGVERRQLVKMNDPLRYGNETFYQSSFDPDESGTVLAVVKNPGWLIPYLSCSLVSIGLLIHFGLHLTQFLSRSRRGVAPAAALAPEPPAGRPAGWFLPGLCVAVVVLYLGSVYGRMAPAKLPFDLDAFAQLPVLEGGRVKPLDSTARVYLRFISGQAVTQDAAGKEYPAIQWYLDTLGADLADKTQPAWDYRVFRIDHEQVLSQLKFQPREGLRFSLNELRPQLSKVHEIAFAAVRKREEGKKLGLEDRKWIELLERLSLVKHVAEGLGHDNPKNKFHLLPPQAEGQTWQSLGEAKAKASDEAYAAALQAARAGLKARPGGFGPAEEKAVVDRLFDPSMPPPSEERRKEIARTLFEADPMLVKEEMREEVYRVVLSELPPAQSGAITAQRAAAADEAVKSNPAAESWERMIAARRGKRAEEFNATLVAYRDTRLGHVTAAELAKVRLETTYNRFAPFMQCIALYIIVFVLSAVGFVLKAAEKKEWGEALRRSASWVLYATLIVHTGALLVRMSLMDRPLVFVTNLYSSAVFIGWGCVALGMVLERLYPIGVGTAVASALGLATTIVAHNLSTDDTLEMMEAVLDTNFWLATHVTTVTLGYTATFVAGFLSCMYVWQLCATVVTDGFTRPQPPSLGALMSFGAAAAGVVGIPMLLLWFVCTAAAAKFEWVHSSIPMVVLVVTGGAAAFYAGGLLFLKAGETATDANGKPLATGQLPAAAKPLAGLALDADLVKVMGQMIYGVLCFATLLSFVGTVLGGIWADQSWGRFWGWDPKENGAVLIVLWNALILHARWCGLVKTRGIAVLAVFGNVICAWSWFGTNQLGIGLHAYGFDTRLADGCTNFWLSQLIIMGLGVIPAQYWASATRRRGDGPAPVAPPPAPTAAPAGPSVVKKKGKKR